VIVVVPARRMVPAPLGSSVTFLPQHDEKPENDIVIDPHKHVLDAPTKEVVSPPAQHRI